MPICNVCGRKVRDLPEHMRKVHGPEPLSPGQMALFQRKGTSVEQIRKHGLKVRSDSTLEGWL